MKLIGCCYVFFLLHCVGVFFFSSDCFLLRIDAWLLFGFVLYLYFLIHRVIVQKESMKRTDSMKHADQVVVINVLMSNGYKQSSSFWISVTVDCFPFLMCMWCPFLKQWLNFFSSSVLFGYCMCIRFSVKQMLYSRMFSDPLQTCSWCFQCSVPYH